MSLAKKSTACRGCDAPGLHPFLDLGEVPLANGLLESQTQAEAERRFPLVVATCLECGLVQLTHTVPPEELFSHYVYLSSFSTTMLEHSRGLTERVLTQEKLGRSSLVIEIASNDGYLLKNYVQAGVPVLGIEPAKNIAEVAENAGVATISEFFGDELASQLVERGQQADVLHANNVFAHVPTITDFVSGIARVLKPNGVAYIEFPYLKDLLDKCEYDTVYHEHVFYLSLTPIERLFARSGLEIVDVERLNIHGGSLRVHAAHRGSRKASPRVQALLDEEQSWGCRSLAPYQNFANQVQRSRDELVALLEKLHAEGSTLAAYGASAKGATLLNYCGIGPKLLRFVADKSTYKVGKLTPGSHLPIMPPESLLSERPDYVLLLAWNFAAEILKEQAKFREAGGKFILPVPHAEVV